MWWTNDRGKWIGLNVRFYWAYRTWKVYGCRIPVVVSCWCGLRWVLKVSAVECHRLRFLIVCGDCMRRWGWSRCLVQIIGVSVWSGCRRSRSQSTMWMDWLQRLDDRCPGLCNSWLIGCISMWPWSVGANLSRVVARGLGDADAVCRGCAIDVLDYSILG